MTITIPKLQQLKETGSKFACLTCYDASFAQVADAAEIEVLLVGDSLGMVIQGKDSTLPVTLEHMCYHVNAVASKARKALIMADMPFMAARTLEAGLDAAMHLMQAGAHLIKLEGGLWLAPLVHALKNQGVPVCVHLGLTPQSVHAFGGYKVQAKHEDAQALLFQTAVDLQTAGADLILLECIPRSVTKQLYTLLNVPVIGIGAGPDCDGQILVNYDILGIPHGHKARFVKNFLDGQSGIEGAFQKFRHEVLTGAYPSQEHCF